MDRVIVGTAKNVAAEYGAYTDGDHEFVLLHMFNEEPVSIEGFATKEQVTHLLAEYEGCEVERLFVSLDDE